MHFETQWERHLNASFILRRILLLFAPLAGTAAILIMMSAGDLALDFLKIEERLPFQLRSLGFVLLLGIAGAATALVTLALEPKHKIRIALIFAAIWTLLLFYLLLRNGLEPWNQRNSSAGLIAIRAFILALTASAGGLLVVYLFKRSKTHKDASSSAAS